MIRPFNFEALTKNGRTLVKISVLIRYIPDLDFLIKSQIFSENASEVIQDTAEKNWHEAHYV